MENLPPRQYKIGEWVKAGEQILDLKGQVYLEAGEEARIMAYYPEKHPNSYALRKEADFMNGPWLSEAVMAKHPEKAHLTPKD